MAEYLPGMNNRIADEEFRTMQSSAEWKLNPQVFNCILQAMGPCQIDLFATCLNHQLCELVTRTFCRGNRCIPNSLEGSAGLCISTLCPDLKVPPEDSSGGEHGGLSRPSVGDPAMVSLSSAASDRLPVVVASSLRPSERSILLEHLLFLDLGFT